MINNIADFFGAFGTFLSNIIDYLLQILSFITDFFSFISSTLSIFIPPPFSTIILSILPFIIIIAFYKIIRKG